jgi:hypothetical protein
MMPTPSMKESTGNLSVFSGELKVIQSRVQIDNFNNEDDLLSRSRNSPEDGAKTFRRTFHHLKLLSHCLLLLRHWPSSKLLSEPQLSRSGCSRQAIHHAADLGCLLNMHFHNFPCHDCNAHRHDARSDSFVTVIDW